MVTSFEAAVAGLPPYERARLLTQLASALLEKFAATPEIVGRLRELVPQLSQAIVNRDFSKVEAFAVKVEGNDDLDSFVTQGDQFSDGSVDSNLYWVVVSLVSHALSVLFNARLAVRMPSCFHEFHPEEIANIAGLLKDCGMYEYAGSVVASLR